MTTLRLSDDLKLPTDAQTQTIVAYGGKGMGKTNFGSVLVEELTRNGLRWAWLDPLGVSWGLRHSADGAGRGIECIILGGPKGDVPIEPDGGAAVADVVVDEPHNVLIDFSRKPSGEMWSVGERIRFVTAYALRLFQRQGELMNGRRREPLFQVLDEAARYIPQVIPSGAPDIAKCVGAWEQLVEEGRNVGLGVGLLTQRSARMNKSVSELADAMFAFRTVGPNSLGAVMDWLGEHVEKPRLKELADKVRTLERGHALVVSPGWLKFEGVVRVRMRETFDSSATPKAGQRARTARGVGARPDLEAIRGRMAATIEKAKQEDPRELRAEIARLRTELKKQPAAPVGKTKTVEIEVIKPATVKALERAIDRVDAAIARAHNVVAKLQHDTEAMEGRWIELRDLRNQLMTQLQALRTGDMGSHAITRDHGAPALRTSPPAPALPPRRPSGPGANLPKGDRQVLTAIAQHDDGVTREQLTILTGYRRSTRDTYVQRLRERKFVDVAGDRITVAQAGLDALGADFEPLPTGDALREHWMARLPEGERRVLEILVAAYPKDLPRDRIDEATGYQRSSRDTYLQRLRARRLVVEGGRGLVRASEALFG